LQCNHKLLFLKGGNSNLIDYNAIAQNKKGRQLQFNRLQCYHEQIKKRDNSNLIDCSAITHKICNKIEKNNLKGR
jgi:hypothetical protein